jgi:hypothetical protein
MNNAVDLVTDATIQVPSFIKSDPSVQKLRRGIQRHAGSTMFSQDSINITTGQLKREESCKHKSVCKTRNFHICVDHNGVRLH